MNDQQPSDQHTHFDQFIAEWADQYTRQQRTIHCRKGCSGCCHLAVHATFPEATPVARELSTENKSKLERYIDRISSNLPELRDLKDYLKSHRQEFGPCPFLSTTGECTIYSLRPFSCRALLSTRPAAWCTVNFSELTTWDKEAYQSSLDRKIVAWPTHFVAATQDFGQNAENLLLDKMRRDLGWSLSGNFAVMVWLEHTLQLSNSGAHADQVQKMLAASGLNHPLLLDFSNNHQKNPTQKRDNHV